MISVKIVVVLVKVYIGYIEVNNSCSNKVVIVKYKSS